MTLDEAIKHAEEVADGKCDKCAEEHRQLAEWLRDYKKILAPNHIGKCDRCGGEIYPNTLCIECNDYLAKSVFAEEIKADIEKYEADCILSDDSKECKECDKIVFGSIYNIIDKHIGKEQE